MHGIAYELRDAQYNHPNRSLLSTAVGRTREFKDRCVTVGSNETRFSTALSSLMQGGEGIWQPLKNRTKKQTSDPNQSRAGGSYPTWRNATK